MNGTGEQLFACSALSFNKDRAIALGDTGQNTEELLHAMVVTDDILKSVPTLDLFAKFLYDRRVSERLDPPNDGAVLIFQ
jgi:hypothetical protein